MKDNTELAGLISALVISIVSGVISITQRILRGYPASILWVLSEFMAAMLCGYLVWDIYPIIGGTLPDWLSMPISVALAAHIGGRGFQTLEGFLYKKWGVDHIKDIPPIPLNTAVKPKEETNDSSTNPSSSSNS